MRRCTRIDAAHRAHRVVPAPAVEYAPGRRGARCQIRSSSAAAERPSPTRQAADVLRGRTVHPDVRCIVIPATQAVSPVHGGRPMDVFLDANCAVSTPTCGPCLGGYMGILAAGERAIATTNRNFVGRMGDPTSEVYLSSPAIAAASAVLGHIGLPEDLD
ncbi:MAG: aconitase family protein [Eggerthellaceae bacterium]